MDDLKQKSIAVIGVSQQPEKYGYRIFRDMRDAGYNVKGVNVRGGEVLGQKIYKSLKELGNVPDLVITVVPAQVTEKVVEECSELGVREIWMQPGSESEAAIEKAREHGMRVTANACIMLAHGMW
jgi:predicted CoA-binding protein